MATTQEQEISIIKKETESLFDKLGIKVKTECQAQKDAPYLLKIIPETEEDSGLIIGWHGESLLAFQHIIRLILKKKITRLIPIVVNVSNYREKQEEALKKIVEEAVSQVARTQKPVILRPMPPYERRIVHLFIKGKDGVKSESIGEGAERRIMISPEKMD